MGIIKSSIIYQRNKLISYFSVIKFIVIFIFIFFLFAIISRYISLMNNLLLLL